MSIEQLMDGVEALVAAATEYYTAVQTIIPVAASSEVLFTRFYDAARSRQRRSARSGVPAGIRQRADQGGEVPLRARDLDSQPSRAGCVAASPCRRSNS